MHPLADMFAKAKNPVVATLHTLAVQMKQKTQSRTPSCQSDLECIFFIAPFPTPHFH